MSEQTLSKTQLLQAFADAYERVIAAVSAAAPRDAAPAGSATDEGGWGPREVVAHLAGWEVMARVRVPTVAAGMPPIEVADEAQAEVMTDAINATIVTMAGYQSLDELCGLLRHAYQRDLANLRGLDERFFQPGEYVYERTRGAIEHCQEHLEGFYSSGG